MGSKSVLILGFVFIFLLNVVAVHNYIDNYYYQPEKIKTKKDENFTSILNGITDLFKKEKEQNQTNTQKIPDEISLEDIDENITDTQLGDLDMNLTQDETLTEYKGSLFNEIQSEKNISDQITPKVDKNISKTKVSKDEKNTTKPQVKKESKKSDDIKDESEKDALIVLNLNINDPYQYDNPIIKKIVNRFDDKKVIKIKIYKYSIKIKDYLETIKSNLVDHGIDIDDIKVIYKKDKNKQNTIKILLSKKD